MPAASEEGQTPLLDDGVESVDEHHDDCTVGHFAVGIEPNRELTRVAAGKSDSEFDVGEESLRVVEDFDDSQHLDFAFAVVSQFSERFESSIGELGIDLLESGLAFVHVFFSFCLCRVRGV